MLTRTSVTSSRTLKYSFVMMICTAALTTVGVLIHDHFPTAFSILNYAAACTTIFLMVEGVISLLVVLFRSVTDIDDGMTTVDVIANAITVPICLIMAAILTCTSILTGGVVGLTINAVVYVLAFPLYSRVPKAVAWFMGEIH